MATEGRTVKKLENIFVDKLFTKPYEVTGWQMAIGPDDILGQVLMECSEELIDPIYYIITCSLRTGSVPREWKRANLIPVHKNGD